MPPGRGFGLPSLRRNVCPHFYMTGSRGAIPIQAPHLLKGATAPAEQHLALPAARRRPPRRGVRQRRVPHAAVQPVRVLRGRADPRVSDGRGDPVGSRQPPDAAALAGDRDPRALRDPPGPGPGPGAPARAGRPGGRPCAARSSRGTNGKGSVIALAGSALRAAGLPGGRDAQAAPRRLPRADRGGRPADRGRGLRAARGRGAAGRGPDRPAARPAHGVRAADRGHVPALRARPASTSRSWRWAWAAASTRRTRGTAAWPS